MTVPSAPSAPPTSPATALLQRETIRFFAIAYALSWALWIPAAILEPPDAIKLPVIFLGAFGPSIAGVLASTPPARRELWRRLIELRRIPPVWWLVLLAFHPLVAALGAWVGTQLGAAPVRLDWTQLATPGAAAGWIISLLLVGPVSEELGWRGYAQDRLQAIGGPFNASIALGILWAMWHLPLFFIDSTSQAAMRFGSWAFWMWTTQVVFQTLVYTWIYNRTGRSLFAAVLFHFIHNAAYSLLVGSRGRLPTEYEIGFTLVTVLAGLLVATEWRVRTTQRERAMP